LNAQTKDTRADWRAQIEDLTARIEAAERAITDAQNAASDAALTGGDLDQATRELAHCRDGLDALRSAKGEAQRHLAQAEADHAQRERNKAFIRAQKIARKRVEVAQELDSFLSAIDPLVVQWRDLGDELIRECHAAGVRAPSSEGNGHRLRAGAWARASIFMGAIEAMRVPSHHRVPVRETSAAQASHILAKD
jgi:multidrug efflux pump subunit AcrA (membrane-fusion protein)